MDNFLTIVAVGFLLMGILGAWVASQKRRGPVEGFLLGLIFGPLGVLVEALLPIGIQNSPRDPGERGTRPSSRLGVLLFILFSFPIIAVTAGEVAVFVYIGIVLLLDEFRRRRTHTRAREAPPQRPTVELAEQDNRSGNETWLGRTLAIVSAAFSRAARACGSFASLSWYSALSDLGQAIVLGLAIALPIAVSFIFLIRMMRPPQ